MEFKSFEDKIGVTFKNRQLLETAFTHRSFLNENRAAGREHNERLEFLGDAVLELVVTEFLYKKYPDKPEGELTAFRAALVNTVSIADAATQLGMNEYLLLSRGEAKDTGRARGIILANAFEAVIGAIYLDQAYELMNQTGPDHDKTFVVAAYLGREKTALGEGRSKQEAEQDAAQKALVAKGW